MSPELRAQQDALAAWIRDPDNAPPPPGVEPRRLDVYRTLFFNTLEGLLAGGFPVIRRTLGEADWHARVRGFQRDHASTTPLFTEIGREFLRHLADHPDPARPWLAELAHYEWIELALQLSDAREDDMPGCDTAPCTDAALLERAPVLSPLAWPLAYAWPVHRIAPGAVPDAAPDAPTLLLLHREASGSVRFHLLTPLTYRLLQRLDAAPGLSGRAQLEALASEAGRDDDAFLDDGLAMLRRWQATRIVLGTRPVDAR
jgi:hypothetical protein